MASIRLHHTKHYDLVESKDGDIVVQTLKGEQKRKRVEVEDEEGFTEITFPDGYDSNPTALNHLVLTLIERHAPVDSIHGVSGDDKSIVAKVAALLDADVITQEN